MRGFWSIEVNTRECPRTIWDRVSQSISLFHDVIFYPLYRAVEKYLDTVLGVKCVKPVVFRWCNKYCLLLLSVISCVIFGTFCTTPPSLNVTLLVLIQPNHIAINALLSPSVKAYGRISTTGIIGWGR